MKKIAARFNIPLTIHNPFTHQGQPYHFQADLLWCDSNFNFVFKVKLRYCIPHSYAPIWENRWKLMFTKKNLCSKVYLTQRMFTYLSL
jgi:hypothetical protein